MHYLGSNIFKTCFQRNARFILCFFVSFFSIVYCKAQDSAATPVTQQQIWPEIDFFYRLNDKFRIFASASATQLYEASTYTDGALSANLDYFAFPIKRKEKTVADSTRGHFLWLRGGFSYSPAPPDSSSNYREYTIRTEINTIFYLPKKYSFLFKNRFDWRFKNDQFIPRYRPKLELDRDFKTAYLTFSAYANIEFYIPLNSNSNSQFLYTFGSEFKVTEHINFEIYFTHQYKNGISAPSVDALGLALKIYKQKGDHWIKNKLHRKSNLKN
jgi:hypothetical protein